MNARKRIGMTINVNDRKEGEGWRRKRARLLSVAARRTRDRVLSMLAGREIRALDRM